MLPNLKELPEWEVACQRYRYDITRFAVEALDMTEESGQPVTWQQDWLFKSIAQNGSRTSVSSGHGCFGRNTHVLLHNGKSKRVKNIKIGDKLLGRDGLSPREVLDLQRGRENLYRFVYQDGSHHVFNESHILCLIHNVTGRKLTLTVRQFLSATDEKRSDWSACKYDFKTKKTNRVLIKRVKALGMGNYYGFVLDGDGEFLSPSGIVLHNTGKTRSAGIIALWHLLFFPESVTMFTAPQIGQLRLLVWKEIEICLARMKTGKLKWLADYVTVLAEKVYVKGFAKTWHVIAKTAPKHQPTNIAGQHGEWYLFWGDEAGGVDDKVLETAMGALTHANNRAVLTSQPVKPTGFFFDTHHKLSTTAGGVWNALVFNSELSPLVSKKTILEMLQKYGSRDDPGYMIRVRGLFPDLANEFLITRGAAAAIYNGRCLDDETTFHDYGYFISVDVGGGVGRDDSVVLVAKVWGEAQWGKRARRIEVVEIPLCKNKDDLHEMTGVIDEMLVKYSNATILIDANGAGSGLAQNLTSKGIPYKKINWGGTCFQKSNREMYKNKRSQAYVCLKRAVDQGRIKILVPKYRKKLEEQITQVPYVFDDESRYKVLSKEQMKLRGIKSPDLGDALAFLFLEGTHYVAANDDYYQGSGSTEEDEWEKLEREAKKMANG